MSYFPKSGLTGNQLKIIAMITMTVDHVGMLLFPGELLLRIIGRLAMPIYAYMIAEGCRHTRDRKKYLLRLLGLGALCQIVYFVSMGSLYQCILITFSLSVGLIMAAEWARKKKGPVIALVMLAGVLTVRFLCDILPLWLLGTDYGVDYGTIGVLLPVLVYFGRTQRQRLLMFTLGTGVLGWAYGGLQWFGLGAVPILALYNGRRGTWNIGKFFYFYYPAHLVLLYGLSMVL